MATFEELRDRLRRSVQKSLETGKQLWELFDAVDQLREFGGMEAARTIAEALVIRDTDTQMHVNLALYALGTDGQAACLDALKDPKTAEHASEWIMPFGNLTDISSVKELLSSSDAEVRKAAVATLGRFGAKWQDLIELLHDPEWSVRERAARELGRERKYHARGLARHASGNHPPGVKEVPCSIQRSGGWGTWESVPRMFQALAHETDRSVVRELKDSLLFLILKFCPAAEIPAYAKWVGETILESPGQRREKLTNYFHSGEYAEFCQRGNLPVWQPFYLALTAPNGQRHLPEVRQGFKDIEDDHQRFEHLPEVKLSDMALASALIQALARIAEPWAIQCLVEVRICIANACDSPVGAECEESIIRLGSSALGPLLKILTTSRYGGEQREAIKVLGKIDDPRAKKPLRQLTRFWSRAPKDLKAAARRALRVSQE